MTNIILSIILFIIYFCTVSCLIYSPDHSEGSQKVSTEPQTLPIEKAVAQMLKEIDNSEPLPTDLVTEPLPTDLVTEPLLTDLVTEPLPTDLVTETLLTDLVTETLPTTIAPETPFCEVFKEDENPVNQVIALNDVELAIEPSIESQQEKSKTVEQTEIDLSKLPLRQARKVAKALNIRQSIKGKDAPVKWLRLQIQKRVEEEPTAIAKIYEVLGIQVDIAPTVDDQVSA